MPSAVDRSALYEQLARVGKAVSAAGRLELLDVLTQAPRTVEELAGQTGMSVANTSRHLQVLRAAGLVDATKRGIHVTYRLASSDVSSFALHLRRLAETQLAELERVKARFFTRSDDVDVLGSRQLLAKLRRGEIILLDVRPTEEYLAGHLRGAVSIPHDELARRVHELPKGSRVVAYCRGPYCVFAAHAAELLRNRGFDAARTEEGVAEWRALGLPVVVGPGAAASP